LAFETSLLVEFASRCITQTLVASLREGHFFFRFFRGRCGNATAAMIAALRPHGSDLSLEDVDRARQGNLRLLVLFMSYQFASFCLTPNLCFGRTVLMMLAAFDVDDDMNQILLPFSEFENPRLG
jgi:hypothetical protein